MKDQSIESNNYHLLLTSEQYRKIEIKNQGKEGAEMEAKAGK